MTRRTTTGRARGVIQEVVTDKIHQIAVEKWSGGGEGGGLLLLPWCCWKYSRVPVQRWNGSRRIWRSATHCLWTRADYCKQAFTHSSSVKPTIISFKPSEARRQKKQNIGRDPATVLLLNCRWAKYLEGRSLEDDRWRHSLGDQTRILGKFGETRISRFPRIGELWQGTHRSYQGCGNWVTRRS